MLKKMVDGVEIICSDEEEALIRMKWDLNNKYPEYQGHLMFDGVNPPVHDMENCKIQFKRCFSQAIDGYIKNLNDQIEIAEENADDTQRSKLISKRKEIKNLYNIDISAISNIEDLKNAVPAQLMDNWNK